VSAFKQFIAGESVTLDYVWSSLKNDDDGTKTTSLMDRFGVYLAFRKNKSGSYLARNTAIQYFRQFKWFLFEKFPARTAIVDKQLLVKAKQLLRHCKLRSASVYTRQANAVTKNDLSKLLQHLYATATSVKNYQDVCLLSLMWYLFGRASDLALLQKQNITVVGGVVLIRFVRMKTAEEQGLSLFPNTNPVICPIFALAVALAMQSTPNIAMLPHLPVISVAEIPDLGPIMPLFKLLNGCDLRSEALDVSNEAEEDDEENVDERENNTIKNSRSVPGIHSHVNRVLDHISTEAGIVKQLTSHGFRRGGRNMRTLM
jgi:hypothetical protein